jgi:PGF-CTERM protein
MTSPRAKLRAINLASLIVFAAFGSLVLTGPAMAANGSVVSSSITCVSSCGENAGNVGLNTDLNNNQLKVEILAGNVENKYDLTSPGTGASANTEYEIDVTTKNFDPTVSYGRANFQGTWTETTSGNQRTMTVTTQPIAYASNSEAGYSVSSWPSENIQATVGADAVVQYWWFPMSAPDGISVEGSYILTDSQAFSGPKVSDANDRFYIPVAAPHLDTSGNVNQGFLKAHLTTSMIDNLYENPTDSQFIAQFAGQQNNSPSISNVANGGKAVLWDDYHYSTGDNEVTVDKTVDTVDAGPDKSTSPGSSVTLDGSGSSDSAGIKSHEWDVDNDNSYEKSGKTVSYSWGSKGDKTVTLKVTDNNDNTDTDSLTVSVSGSGGGGDNSGSSSDNTETDTSAATETATTNGTNTTSGTETGETTDTGDTTETGETESGGVGEGSGSETTSQATTGAEATSGSGPGFGPVLALITLVVVPLLWRRRRP